MTKLYSDISFHKESGICGWAYVLAENGKITLGPFSGTLETKWSFDIEGIPVKIATAKYKIDQVVCDGRHGITGLRSVRPEKNDPFYVLCHYVARYAVFQNKI